MAIALQHLGTLTMYDIVCVRVVLY